MAGRGPAPKDSGSRRRTNTPERGEWKASPGRGWQHGDLPAPPGRLLTRTRAVWTAWFRSWFAAYWTPDNIPQLLLTIQYYDQVQRAIDEPFIEADGPRGSTMYFRRPSPMTELRQNMDSLGITPKGQQDRRWKMPEAPVDQGASPEPTTTPDVPAPYQGLRVVAG